jgi:hypothetical protein
MTPSLSIAISGQADHSWLEIFSGVVQFCPKLIMKSKFNTIELRVFIACKYYSPVKIIKSLQLRKGVKIMVQKNFFKKT